MTFESWLARLRDRGFVTCPTSSAVPVDLRALAPDGTGLHFRCRGVRVRLGIYRPGRAAWQTPLRDEGWSPEESLELWEQRPVRDTEVPLGGRLVFAAAGVGSDTGAGSGSGSGPDAEIVLDGSRTHGWRGYEAGLLRVDQAVVLFESMLIDAGLTGLTGPAGGLAAGLAEPRRAAWAVTGAGGGAAGGSLVGGSAAGGSMAAVPTARQALAATRPAATTGQASGGGVRGGGRPPTPSVL